MVGAVVVVQMMAGKMVLFIRPGIPVQKRGYSMGTIG